MRRIALLAACVFWVALIFGLGARLTHAQGCWQIDAFGELCTPAGPEIFTQFAHQKLVQNGWIDRSQNKKGERCCDAGKDCHSLGPERIEHVQGGVNITLDTGQKVFVPGGQIMPSEDGKWWLCYWSGQVKCVFSPYSGS